MTLIEDINREAYEACARSGRLRYGQAVMNALAVRRLDLYRLVPPNVDPFYDDTNLPAFWEWLEAHKDKPPHVKVIVELDIPLRYCRSIYELRGCIRARLMDEAGYLDDGTPIQPDNVTVTLESDAR